VKLMCKYCKLVFDCATFADVEKINTTQCWITVKGVNHHLNEVVN